MVKRRNMLKVAVVLILLLCLCITLALPAAIVRAAGDRDSEPLVPPFAVTVESNGNHVTVSLISTRSFTSANIGGTVLFPPGFVCTAIDSGADLKSCGLNLLTNHDNGVFLIDGPSDGSNVSVPSGAELLKVEFNTADADDGEYDLTVLFDQGVADEDGTSLAWENGTVSGKITIKSENGGETPIPVTPEDPADNEIDVVPPVKGEVTTDPDFAAEDEDVTITVTPDDGYEADTVTVTDKYGKEVPVKDNGDGTYSFIMPDGPVTVDVTFKESEGGGEPMHDCPSKHFVDFDPDAWYHEAVDYAVVNGLMKGTSPITFEPGTTTMRAMIVTILWRLEGEPVVNAVNPFDDVVNGAWYTDAIVWAADNGIVEGYGDGRFGPSDNITREQLATILFRYAKYKGYDVSAGEETNILSYDDAGKVSGWAMPAMQWAIAEGLIRGRTESAIVPQGNANRAETAAIFMRFIENV